MIPRNRGASRRLPLRPRLRGSAAARLLELLLARLRGLLSALLRLLARCICIARCTACGCTACGCAGGAATACGRHQPGCPPPELLAAALRCHPLPAARARIVVQAALVADPALLIIAAAGAWQAGLEIGQGAAQ